MDEMAEHGSDEMLSRPNFLCPEILHPGQTGCRYTDIARRVESIEEIANGHTQTLTRVEAYGEATAFWAKVVAGLIAILGVAAAIYFGSLEARGKSGMLRHNNSGEVTTAQRGAAPQMTVNNEGSRPWQNR